MSSMNSCTSAATPERRVAFAHRLGRRRTGLVDDAQAPESPPQVGRRRGHGFVDAVRPLAAAEDQQGEALAARSRRRAPAPALRTGLPVTHDLAARKERSGLLEGVQTRRARCPSTRLAIPGRAFCSKQHARNAAQPGGDTTGKDAYPPTPTTTWAPNSPSVRQARSSAPGSMSRKSTRPRTPRPRTPRTRQGDGRGNGCAE